MFVFCSLIFNLQYAANGGYKDIVAMLLQNKTIDVKLKNHHRQTGFHFFA